MLVAKIYVYNQSLVSIRTFRPTTWLSDRRNINACDSPLDAKILTVVAAGGRSSPWRKIIIVMAIVKCRRKDVLVLFRVALTLISRYLLKYFKKFFTEQTLTLISRYPLKDLKKLLRKQTLTLLTALRAVTKICWK